MSGPARNLESLRWNRRTSFLHQASHRILDSATDPAPPLARRFAVLATLDDSPFVLRLPRGRVVIVALLAFDQGFCCMFPPLPSRLPRVWPAPVIPPNFACPTCHPDTFLSSWEPPSHFFPCRHLGAAISVLPSAFCVAASHGLARGVGVTLLHPHFGSRERLSPPNPRANYFGPARYLS